MKKVLLLVFYFMTVGGLVHAQTIALTFTAKFEGLHKPLDSVLVQNLTQGGDTVLYGSDTTLILSSTIGMEENGPAAPAGLTLLPNHPNPFNESTTIRFYLPGDELVALKVFDLTGRELTRHVEALTAGLHSFSFYPGQGNQYLLSVETRDQRRVQKLIHIGPGTGRCRMEHSGWQPGSAPGQRKSQSGFPWVPGDELRYFGFAGLGTNLAGHNIINDIPAQSKVCIFNLLHGMPCMSHPFATDHESNVYRTVRIGSQCWMRENLKSVKYNDGSAIPANPAGWPWQNLTSGALGWYNGDSATYHPLYGPLYNWYAIASGNLCPTGWHVPAASEWATLVNYVGGQQVAGLKLKEKGWQHWHSTNTGTNDYGFTALPGGFANPYGSYVEIGGNTTMWTSSEGTFNSGTNYYTYHFLEEFYHQDYDKSMGASVRCIMNDTAAGQVRPQTAFTASDTVILIHDTVFFTDISAYNPVSWKWYFGDGDSSSLQHPSHVYTAKGTYTITLITGNAWGCDTLEKQNHIKATGPVINYPVADVDGNLYDTIDINNTIWLRKNLRTTHYNDGTPIPGISDTLTWTTLTTGARCWYNNDSAVYADIYGSLYNWHAVNTGKLCPAGWHVPNFPEWEALFNYLGGASVAGGKLKETGTAHWMSPNTGATNETGFTALPGGYRQYSGNAPFSALGTNGYWWSASDYGSAHAWNPVMNHTDAQINWGFTQKKAGMAVRCVFD